MRHAAWRAGDGARTLRLPDEETLHAPLERIAISPFFSQAFDRFLRAEVLAAVGRLDEALRWFASLAEGPDVAFTGPAHLRQWELLSQARRTDAAAGHARRLAELWSDAEPTVRARAAGVFTSRLD